MRNPHDRIVSCYENHMGRPKDGVYIGSDIPQVYRGIPFKEFIRVVSKIPDEKADRHFRSKVYDLKDKKGKIFVDFIGKFENLEEDYKKVCKKIGLRNPPKLPHKNKGRSLRSYNSYYDDETRKLVQRRYEEDFKVFNYQK